MRAGCWWRCSSCTADRHLAAALVPGATFELVRDAGLFPWLEQPQQLHAAVAGALRPSI